MECVKKQELELSHKIKMLQYQVLWQKKKIGKKLNLKLLKIIFVREKAKEEAEEIGINPQVLAAWRSQHKH